jgi:hypothetical protein
MTSVVDERYGAYGNPRVNMQRTAELWSAYLGHEVSAHDVAMCMILLKASRSKVTHHSDNYEDIRGYADIAEGMGDLRG